MSKYSIVEYFSDHDGHKCGYCNGENSNLSHGMWAHSLTVEDYQGLIDRGWRRSGKYVYKPTMNMTCCPQYVIKCEVLNFKPSKSHKKIIKRNNKYFNTGIQPGAGEISQDDGAMQSPEEFSGATASDISLEQPRMTKGAGQATTQHTQESSSHKPRSTSDSDRVSSTVNTVKTDHSSKSGEAGKGKRPPKPGVGADPDRPRCVKAKQRRLDRKLQKQGESAVPRSSNTHFDEAKSLEDHLNGILPDSRHKLEVRLCRSSPKSRIFSDTFDESYNVYKKYQIAVHGDPPEKITKSQYSRFLVESPLEAEESENSVGYGSFHQHYLLDGKIVAVGVLDILPHAVSSVYLYYDPDYRFLTLGVYSALREIAFVRELSKKQPSVTNYYMGFYIHSCPKMRYKAQYTPSYLACPETYNWFPVEQCRPSLDAAKYCRFDVPGKEDRDGVVRLDEVMCLHQRKPMPYAIYRALNSNVRDADEVRQYASLAGMTCASRMLLYRASHELLDED